MSEFPNQFSGRLTDSGIVSVDQLNKVRSLLQAMADGEPDPLVPGDRKR